MSRKIAGLQKRATTYVRTNGVQSIRVNDPDGWMASSGPAWYVGQDGLFGPLIGSDGWDESSYGMPARPGNRVYGGSGYHGAGTVSGAGILPAVTRATAIVTGPTVRTSWRFYKGSPTQALDLRQGQELVDRPLWVIDPQLVGSIPGGEGPRPTIPRPKRLGGHDFWRSLLTHALWFGHGAMMYVEDAFGQPLAGTLRVVHPAMWAYTSDGRFVLDPDGNDPFESDFDGVFTVGPVRWHMRVLHGYAPQDDSVGPEGALSRAGLVIQGGERLNSYLASVLRTGVPSGVLKVSTPNYDQPQAEALKQRWMESHGGVKRSVAVLNSGVDFQPLQLDLVKADVVNAKAMNLVDIAHAFNLSASWLDASIGAGSSITYANISERRRDLLDHTLGEWGRSLEDFVTGILPWGLSLKIDWSGYLNTDPTRDLEFVEQGLDKGYLTKHEARDRLGLDVNEDVDQTCRILNGRLAIEQQQNGDQ